MTEQYEYYSQIQDEFFQKQDRNEELEEMQSYQ
jgi:hypothetical protein